MAALELIKTTLYNDANLVGYYQFTSDFTFTSKGYNLTAINAPTFPAGNFGSVGSFVQASAQYARLVTSSCPNYNIGQDQTWMFWVYVTGTTGNVFQHPFAMLSTDYHRLYIAESTMIPTFNLANLTTNTTVNASGSITIGAWTMLTGRYDSVGSTLAIFVNKTKTSVTASGTAVDESAGTFYLGNGNPPNLQSMNGAIDDFAIFNRALSDTEINNHFDGLDALPTSAGFRSLMGVGLQDRMGAPCMI
jgi:hypothetical protein